MVIIPVAVWIHLSFNLILILFFISVLINGVAQGYLRKILNSLLENGKNLPRILGIAATLSEVVFAVAPVFVTLIGTNSIMLAFLVVSILGSLPVIIIPKISTQFKKEILSELKPAKIRKEIIELLICACVTSLTVAIIEVGAIEIAISYKLNPFFSIRFTIPLCISSVLGGIWISLKNENSSRIALINYMLVMSIGISTIAAFDSITCTLIGIVIVGLTIAPIGTQLSLIIDESCLENEKTKVFSLLKTTGAIGILNASLILYFFTINDSLFIISSAISITTLALFLLSFKKNSYVPFIFPILT